MSANCQYDGDSDNRLFQLRGETSYLFTTIWQATKAYILPTTLDFPENMSRHSILALEI